MMTIRLYGPLAKKHGKQFRMNVRSPRQAVHALCVLRPGFKQDILTMAPAYKLRRGAKIIREEALDFPVGEKTLHITPLFAGAGKGLSIGEAILGAALIVVGVAFPAVSFLILPGVSLLLGGVAGLLAGTPNITPTADPKNRKPSYQFNGPVNTVAQGHPVPVLLGGPFWTGSAVASEGISSDNIVYSTSSGMAGTGAPGPNGGTGTPGGYSNFGGGKPGAPIYAQEP